MTKEPEGKERPIRCDMCGWVGVEGQDDDGCCPQCEDSLDDDFRFCPYCNWYAEPERFHNNTCPKCDSNL